MLAHTRGGQGRSPGFTLIELMVVIAVIGVLITLLLPAVHKVREGANLVKCQNNLKQIGLALHNFQIDDGAFPTGTYGFTGGYVPTNRGSILLYLLPYIEQNKVLDLYDLTTCTDTQMFPNTTTYLDSSIIPTYICPSDDHPAIIDGHASQNYSASNGPTLHIANPFCPCTLSYDMDAYALAPYDLPGDYAGVFNRFQVGGTTIEMITDGLSSTIFFGETRPACSVHVARGWGGTDNSQGFATTLVPINTDTCQPNNPNGCFQPCNATLEMGFRSMHPGGANFLIGDGSVRLLTQTIDMWTYQYLGAKADGNEALFP